MATLIADAESFQRDGQRRQAGSAKPPETVSVTLITPQSKSALFFKTKTAISLLEKFKKDSKDDKLLISDLLHFQERIEE